METRSPLDTSGISFQQYTMPPPFSRRKGNGSGPSVPPATTTGTPVSPPKFAITYNRATVSGILMAAGMEEPIPEDDESPADRMADHIMKHLKLPQQWISAEPHMLS